MSGAMAARSALHHIRLPRQLHRHACGGYRGIATATWRGVDASPDVTQFRTTAALAPTSTRRRHRVLPAATTTLIGTLSVPWRPHTRVVHRRAFVTTTASLAPGDDGHGSDSDDVVLMTPREVVEVEQAVMDALDSVKDAIVGESVAALGWARRVQVHPITGAVMFDLALDTLAHPEKDRLVEDCIAAVANTPAFQARFGAAAQQHVTPRLVARAPAARKRVDDEDGLGAVSNIIAVSSCKGGTGKSTVAVNLAFSLMQQGARVGILDADIYGPSLPAMVSPEDDRVFRLEDGLVEPVVFENVKCMSYGYVAPRTDTGEAQSAVMRGPMVGSIANQIASRTAWGDLDFLVLDLPPGTGDINLTLCQALPITAAVIVTTPHKLSFIDVVKGIEMFDTLKVPPIALVENMAYFECEHGTRYHPFGEGYSEALQARYGFSHVFRFPINESTATATGNGQPVVLVDADDGAHPHVAQFSKLAKHVVAEVMKGNHGASAKAHTSVAIAPDNAGVAVRRFSDAGAAEVVIPSRELRLRCKCAACVDEFTLQNRIVESEVPLDVAPTKVQPRGNYAVAIQWSDGHVSSIYPYDTLNEIAAELGASGGDAE